MANLDDEDNKLASAAEELGGVAEVREGITKGLESFGLENVDQMGLQRSIDEYLKDYPSDEYLKDYLSLPPHFDDTVFVTDHGETHSEPTKNWIRELRMLDTEEARLSLLIRSVNDSRGKDQLFLNILKQAAAGVGMSEDSLSELDRLINEKLGG